MRSDLKSEYNQIELILSYRGKFDITVKDQRFVDWNVAVWFQRVDSLYLALGIQEWRIIEMTIERFVLMLSFLVFGTIKRFTKSQQVYLKYIKSNKQVWT